MKKAVRLWITGSLQGIFFRQFIQENADAHNVKGYMRKLEDGRTEIWLEGDSAQVDAMILICSQGPKYANIRQVDKKEERMQDFKVFKVLRF